MPGRCGCAAHGSRASRRGRPRVNRR
jgi:hypothetical protein